MVDIEGFLLVGHPLGLGMRALGRSLDISPCCLDYIVWISLNTLDLLPCLLLALQFLRVIVLCSVDKLHPFPLSGSRSTLLLGLVASMIVPPLSAWMKLSSFATLILGRVPSITLCA